MSQEDCRSRFLEGMSRAACSVTIVTTEGEAGRAGVTVSAMASVSADGPQPCLLVCVHHLSPAAAKIAQNGVFCVNLLGAGQSAVSDTFAGRRKPLYGDKFADFAWGELKTGAPVLDDALVAFDCTVMQTVEMGTHRVFFGAVQAVRHRDEAPALIYTNRAYAQPAALMEQ